MNKKNKNNPGTKGRGVHFYVLASQRLCLRSLMSEESVMKNEMEEMGDAYMYCLRGVMVIAVIASMLILAFQCAPRIEKADLELTSRGWMPKTVEVK